MELLAQMSVPVLPSPALIPRMLFENPMLLTSVFIVLGVAGFVVFNARGKVKNAVIAGVLGFVLAAGVQILAMVVVTPREKLMKATTELIAATAQADTVSLSPMLDPRARLSDGFHVRFFPSGGEAADKTEVLARVREYVGNQYPLKECAILEQYAVVDGPGVGRSQVRVRTTLQAYGMPIISWWRIDWREGKEGWMVTEIQPLDLGIAGVRLR